MHVHYALCTCGIYTKCIAPRRPPGLAGFLTPLGGRSSHGRAARPDLHGLPKRPSIRGRSLRPSWHASEYNHTSSRPLWRRCHECTLAISAHRRSHSSACVSWPGKLRSRADPCLDYQSAGCELAPRQSSNHAHAPPSLPYRWPNVPAREKGVDVMLAVYFVRAAIEKQADILILASRDTDLLPAVEMAIDLGKAKVETCMWENCSRLRLSRYQLWCTYLSGSDYLASKDRRQY
jgi:uncharacterized LabA/DUF88 family protein